MKIRLGPPFGGIRGVTFEPEGFWHDRESGVRIQSFKQKQVVFSQGDRASSLFYVSRGRVRLTLFSNQGKAATIAILGKRDFLGDECLLPGQPLRAATAIAVTDCSLTQIDREPMLAALDDDLALAGFFMEYLLESKLRLQEHLANQIHHPSEKRLVRLLLLLARLEEPGNAGSDFSYISHEILAEMVGTTRPRISYFMNKFRRMGLIDDSRGLFVAKELENMLQ